MAAGDAMALGFLRLAMLGKTFVMTFVNVTMSDDR